MLLGVKLSLQTLKLFNYGKPVETEYLHEGIDSKTVYEEREQDDSQCKDEYECLLLQFIGDTKGNGYGQCAP